MSGGGTQTTTEQSQTTYPQWQQDALAGNHQTAQGMVENFLRNPTYATAGFNTDQLKGFDLARDSARGVFEGGATQVPGAGSLMAPAGMTAAQVDGAGIVNLMNPFLDQVGARAMDALRRDYRNADAGIGARYAARGGFGGSGEALARAGLARDTGQTAASTIAGLSAQAYDNAARLALANAQLRQQAEQTNAGFQQQAGLANQDAGFKGAQLNDQFRTSQQARELSALATLLAGGQTQQDLAQRSLDTPFTMLQRLASLTPQQLNSQTTGTKETEGGGTSPLQMLLGAGTTLLGAKTAGGGSIAASLLGLSDEREKTDIKKLGRDPETGLDMYAYRYKDDPKTYPKVVGPMAQDIEQAMPGATREIGGKKVVTGGLLQHMAKRR